MEELRHSFVSKIASKNLKLHQNSVAKHIQNTVLVQTGTYVLTTLTGKKTPGTSKYKTFAQDADLQCI